jgi:hypothetical protein
VEEIAGKLVMWLTLPREDRAKASAALAEVARERFGWERVAEGVLAAAQGRLGELLEPPPADGDSEHAEGPGGAPSGTFGDEPSARGSG